MIAVEEKAEGYTTTSVNKNQSYLEKK